jgi:hypothetical protein
MVGRGHCPWCSCTCQGSVHGSADVRKCWPVAEGWEGAVDPRMVYANAMPATFRGGFVLHPIMVLEAELAVTLAAGTAALLAAPTAGCHVWPAAVAAGGSHLYPHN